MQAVKLALVLACMPAIALAEDEAVPASVAEPVTAPALDELEADVYEIYRKQRELEAEQESDKETRKFVDEELRPLTRFITVFVDVGAFAVAGDGSGIRPDIGHVYFPQYRGQVAGQWVFMGDPLSTAINSLGEPSDTSISREIESDTINSEGRPSIVVNTIGLGIGKYLGHGFAFSSLAQVLPRPEDTALDLQLASIDYRPSHDINLLISVGKIDSVLGVEYRSQDAPDRTTVTPSLLCRYTCGRPLGASARLTKGRLSTHATITNGDNFQQLFQPEHALKSNALPTLSGHVQWMLPIGQGLEIGVSGTIGPQDNQPELGVVQWHYGLDLRLLDLEGFDVTAEYIQGEQEGKTDLMTTPCDIASCLTYKAAYLLVANRVTDWATPYVRTDWRSAVHTSGADFIYESHTFRATVGARFEMTSRIIGKIEYTHNRELGGIPQFPDDVLTSSVVVTTR